MYKLKISLESCPSPVQEILVQDANVALLVDRACHPPPPAPICLMHGEHPIPWGRGRHFHQFLGCNSPLVSHQHADELGHDHHSGKGWTWTHQQISHETSTDGFSSGACVPIRDIGGDDHESVWGIWLDVLSDTQLLPVFGPCGQKHDVQFAWSALPWFSTMRETCFSSFIRIRAWSSLRGVILNWSPCGLSWLFRSPEHDGGLWRCHLVTLLRSSISPSETATTRQPNNEFKNSRWDIGWHDCHFILKLQFMHSDSTQLNVFDTNVIVGGLWNFVRGLGWR